MGHKVREVISHLFLTLAVAVSVIFAHSDIHAQAVADRTVLMRAFERFPVAEAVPDTVSIVFIGDVMLHQAQIENTRQPDGSHCFEEYFRSLEKDFQQADVCVANMEFTLGGKPYSGYPAFSAPDSYAEYMAKCGIDIFLTANNHILDKGEKGFRRTLEQYRTLGREYGIKFTGSTDSNTFDKDAGPLMIYVKGLRIALINFTYGTNTAPGDKKCFGPLRMGSAEIEQTVSIAKKLEADYIIALPHWGNEYILKHSVSQRDMAEMLANLGVDAIIGTHPHVVQDFEEIEISRKGSGDNENVVKKVPVVYSVGNAVSNMSAPDTQAGLMVTLSICKSPEGTVEFNSIKFTYLWCSLAGRLRGSHCTVKIADMLDKKDEWIQKYEYDKMVSTYKRVQKATGIKDSL